MTLPRGPIYTWALRLGWHFWCRNLEGWRGTKSAVYYLSLPASSSACPLWQMPPSANQSSKANMSSNGDKIFDLINIFSNGNFWYKVYKLEEGLEDHLL